GQDRVSIVHDHERREVREAGDRQKAIAQRRHPGQADSGSGEMSRPPSTIDQEANVMKRTLLIVLVGAALLPGGCNRSRDAAIEVKAVAAADPAPSPAQPAPAEPPATSVVENSGPFAFPDDSGGKLLERMLPPDIAFRSAQEGAHGPLLRIAPAFVEQPEIALSMPPLKLP